jgi:hypothetical protein
MAELQALRAEIRKMRGEPEPAAAPHPQRRLDL